MNRQRIPSTGNAPAQAPVGQINMIGKGAVIEGTLRVDGDVRVGGKIVGEIQVDGKLITTEEGVIEGDIVALNADVAGTMKGSLVVKDRLILRSTCRVESDVQTSKFIIEDGALFSGKCSMNPPQPSAPAPAQPSNGAKKPAQNGGAPKVMAKPSAPARK